MEKFCIVKRRKQGILIDQELVSTMGVQDRPDRKVTDIAPYMAATSGRIDGSSYGLRDKGNGQTIRVQLTPEQCTVMRTNATVKDLLGRTVGKVGLNIEEDDAGRIVFTFHLKHVYGAKMLHVREVCEMLQISKSFLMRLVREGQLKSYKLGRLRRFLLEDVLEYLTKNDAVVELLHGEPDEPDESCTEFGGPAES
jgi:excisionase family DNA binding protein